MTEPFDPHKPHAKYLITEGMGHLHWVVQQGKAYRVYGTTVEDAIFIEADLDAMTRSGLVVKIIEDNCN